MDEFILEGHDFIELNKLLKFISWVNSGGEAKQVIDEGLVMVNGEKESRRRRKLYANDSVSFNSKTVTVKSP